MMPSVLRLNLVSLGLLISHASCMIQVYRRQNGTVSPDPIYTIRNNYQSTVGQRNSDFAVYLKVADPPDACRTDQLDFAPRLHEDEEGAQFFLLADDQPCGKPSKLRKGILLKQNDNGFANKILYAQEKGYSGVIVYASLFEQRTKLEDADDISVSSWPTRSRTEPFPVSIPEHAADRIKLDVHFIGYEDGKRLTKFAYDPSSETRYCFNFTLPAQNSEAEAATSNATLPVDVNWNTYQLPNLSEYEPTYPPEIAAALSPDAIRVLFGCGSYYDCPLTTDTPDNSTSTRWFPSNTHASEPFDRTLFVAIFVPVVVGLAYYSLRYLYRRHKIRVAAEQLRAAQALADEEIARHLAFRQHLVQRFIEAFMAQLQAAEQQDHIRANGMPLTTNEMEQLNQMQVTDPSDDICTTCQQTFTVGETKVVLPCSHVGHQPCLTTWLTTYSRNCPVCRQPVRAEAANASPPACTFPVQFPDSPVLGRHN